MFEWSAEQYSKFKYERTLPAVDLANSIDCKNVKSVLDIGCGIGNSTAVLAQKFPNAKIIGVDNSDDMLASARRNNPDIEFLKLDVEKDIDNLENQYDVVFSNACIQWIPNHRKLLRSLFGLSGSGGVLAIQIPQQSKHPVHGIIRFLCEQDKWRNKIVNKREYNNLTENEYFDVLAELSDNFRIWETTYFFSMPSYQSIVEWYKGTGLRPCLEQLSKDDAAEFLNDFSENIKKLYPVQKSGKIIFKFPRLFFTAEK